MIINLIKFKQMFSLTLPNKVKGQYWVTDIDENGSPRNLISVEAVRGELQLRQMMILTEYLLIKQQILIMSKMKMVQFLILCRVFEIIPQ